MERLLSVKGKQTSQVNELSALYGKTQEPGLIEILPLICISVILPLICISVIRATMLLFSVPKPPRVLCQHPLFTLGADYILHSQQTFYTNLLIRAFLPLSAK